MLSAIVFFLLLFTPLIFLHELGHYLVAKACGVRVEAFSVGFGRVIWKRQAWGTEWRLSAIPFGGYVKMAGENHADDRTPEPDELWAKSPMARAAIAFAGPAVNLALPVLVFTWFLMGGYHYVAPVIGGVSAGSAAAEAGIQPGDRVIRIDGQEVKAWEDLSGLIGPAAGRDIDVVLKRGERTVTIKARPSAMTVEDPLGGLKQRGMLGITSTQQQAVVVPRGTSELRPFDRITAVDGTEVDNLIALRAAMAGKTSATLTIERDSERKAGRPIDGSRSKTLTVPWSGETLEPAELLVEGTKEGSPAAEAGLMAMDRITAINGIAITTWSELEQTLLSAEGFRGTVTFRRGDEKLEASLALREASVDGPLRSSRQVMDHGIVRAFWHRSPTVETAQLGLGGAVVMATKRCAEIVATMAEGLRRILVGRVSVKQIGGPVMLYDIAAQVSQTRDTFWHWFSLLSLNLGLMNLLPVPVLDGGLILLSAVELVRRRPLTIAMREKANLIGLALVMALMVTAVINDIMRVFAS